MRNYTNNTEKTATFRNLYNGEELTIKFPATDSVLDYAYWAMSCNGEHDYILADSCNFRGMLGNCSQFYDIYDVNEIAERLEALEDEDADKLEAMAEVLDDLDDIERAWDDSYFIADTTMADYAKELCYECGYMPKAELPEWISCHIDWEGVGRELSVDGYSEINGGVLYVAE